jgi:hypothetical protein
MGMSMWHCENLIRVETRLRLEGHLAHGSYCTKTFIKSKRKGREVVLHLMGVSLVSALHKPR